MDNEQKIDTGLKDCNGQAIYVGDKLRHLKDDYDVIVYMDNPTEGCKDNTFSGKLVCKKWHPCENIPYSLCGGSKYMVIATAEDLDETKQLATFLHGILCRYNHASQCRWFDVKKDDWTSYEKKLWLERAKEALKIADIKTVKDIASIIND